MPKDKRKIWRVQEMDGKGWTSRVVTGQTRYVPALTRNEAKEIYKQKYKKYGHTSLSATVISRDMREWEE
jgi:lysozyme family protein